MCKVIKMKIGHKVDGKICEEYLAGASSIILSRKYGVGQRTILRILERYKVPRRSLHEAMRKYHADYSHFDIIDTPGKAYFLGFLVADAHLRPKNGYGNSALRVNLALRDKKHLHKLLNEIKSNHPVHVCAEKHPSCWIEIRSNQLVGELHRHGVSYPGELSRFSNLTPELRNHFVRGIWDGDGALIKRCSGDWMWFITGQFPLLAVVQQTLMKECNLRKTKIKKDVRRKATYTLQYGGNLQVPRIVEWLYQGVTPQICLDRKAAKAAEMFADLRARGAGLWLRRCEKKPGET